MPTVSAVIFTTWAQDVDGNNVPDAIDDIFAWAIVNNENLPQEPTCYGRYEDVTAILASNIAVGKVFVAKLEVSLATAQQFANDPRIFVLGRRILDDEGNITNSNWDTPLTVQQRTQALNWLENHGISRQQVAARFNADDTRLEIARKLKTFFKE